MRTSIRRKFLTLSFAFFAAMAVIVVAMATLGKETLVHLSLDAQLEVIGQAFDGIVAAEGDRALSLAEAFAALPGVPEAFAAGERDKLLALTAPAFERLRKQSGVEQMQFHTSTSHSFLRVHQPKKYGDDLSSFRTTVVAANREKRRISGLENGVAGFGIRGVVPVTHDGRHIGTFEMGMSLAEPFVRTFARRVRADIAIFVRPASGKPDETKLLSSTSTAQWHPDHALIAKAFAGPQIVPLVTDQDRRLALVVRPLLDFSGKAIGVSAIAIDRSTFDAEVTALSQRISIAGLVLFLAAMAGLNWLLMDIVRPLASFRRAIEHVTSGRIDIAIDYTQRADELGVVARAIDNLRSGIANARAVEAERQRDAAAQAEADARTAAAEAAAAKRQTAMVESLRAALERVAKGDLTVRLTQGFEGSYRRIMDDFNTAIAQLESALGTVTQSARAIAARSETMSNSGAEIRARAEQQAVTLQEISAELNVITSTGAMTAQGATSAHQTVADASAEATETGVVVERTIHAMQDIERSSKEIMQIIGVIDEIAFQTNLLALNAGVEAARAGDAGRGFAVVAAEVRGLAQRSAEAAKQIKSLITTSSREVGAGADLVRDAGQSLRRILARVDAIKTLVSEIGAGTQEQASGLTHINASIGQIDRVTQQSAAQVAEASESCGKLRAEATRLSELVAGFTISASPTRATVEEPPRYARAS